MAKRKKEYPSSHLKVLGAIYALNKEGFSPTSDGVYDYLTGNSDFGEFASLPFFASLLSIGKKRHGSHVNSLLLKGCLKEVALEEGDPPYLVLTELGERLAKPLLEKESQSKGKRAPSKARLPRYVKKEIVESKMEER